MLPLLLQHVEAQGFATFDGGYAYNLNIVGIRSTNAAAGNFDDAIACAYRKTIGGAWHVKYWPATTDAGKFWLSNPLDVDGTAILKEGQYRGAYVLGRHRGQYEALTQAEPVTVWRDNNRDYILDRFEGSEQTGLYGINIHKAGVRSSLVGRWSAGCQVFARAADFDQLIELCHKQIASNPTWRPRFTYTLLEL